MRSVRVQVPAVEFSGAMIAIAEWFDANGYEPTRYKYTQRRHAVLVTIDLPSTVAANAFAMRFGVYQQFSKLASPELSVVDAVSNLLPPEHLCDVQNGDLRFGQPRSSDRGRGVCPMDE